jgi:hypothetical protein
MWSLPIAILGPELDRIPGDLGDARFGNYMLEHFHRYSTGAETSFWNAPYLYPRMDRSVQTDRLAGSAPFYDLFRRFGWRPESAFQLWMVMMFVLNFWAAWWALRGFGAATVPSACGAFLYAFGIHQIDVLGHPEIYARFAIPLALLGWWRVLQGGGLRWWILAIGATVLQFWCSMALGYFLVFGLVALIAAHMLVFRSLPWRARLQNKRTWAGALVTLGVGVLLLLPLHTVRVGTDEAPVELAMHRVPELRSHFITHPAALSWQNLRWSGGDELTEWWYHQHFMGAVAWAGVLLALALLVRYRVAPDHRPLFALLLAWSFTLLLCLRIGEVCTFVPVWRVLGSPYLSGVEQVVLVQAFFFALLFALAMTSLSRWRAGLLFASIALPLITVLDQQVRVAEIKRYDKHDAIKALRVIDHWIQVGRQPTAKAMAWCPVQPPLRVEEVYAHVQHAHLSAMLAAQQRGWPVVNAYVKFAPAAYVPYQYALSSYALAGWLDAAVSDKGPVQVVDNVGVPYDRADKQLLTTTSDGVVNITGVEGVLRTSRGPGGLEGCFTLIHLRDGRSVWLASNGRFVAADLSEGDGTLRADADIPGDFCSFVMVPVGDGSFCLLADNGRFVKANTDGVLQATADSLEQALALRVAALPSGVQ